LAGIYRANGDLDRAASVLSEAAVRFERSLPPGHGAFAGLALQRALHAQATGDLQAALKLSNEAVAVVEASMKVRGAHRLPVFLISRSDILLQLGRPDEARGDAERAVSILREGGLTETPSSHSGRAYLTLGRALKAQGKDTEARAAFGSAAEHLRDALAPDHPETRSAQRKAEGQERT
jgi:tetratricopeptide (TPR) repeat protein